MKLSKEVKDRWNRVTKKDLYELVFKQGLSDAIIAEMYGVPKSAVTYKRSVKFNLKFRNNSEAMRRSIRDVVLEELRQDTLPVKQRKIIADCIIKACGYLPLEEWER